VVHAAGTNTFMVDQTQNNGTWVLLVTTNFAAGTNGSLLVRNGNTSGYVIADAARWICATAAPPVQIIATDPIACETGKEARVTFVRSAGDATATITVNYNLGGTATNGVDYTALPGTVTLPAGVAVTNFAVHAVADALPEGDRLLSITLQPGAGYAVGTLSNAVVRILDTPFDGWRFAHFTAAELNNPAISGTDADPDHDGATNWQEFLVGTDPRDAASVLRMSIDAVTNTARLSFSAGANHGYTLQYRDNLNTGGWMDLTNLPPLTAARTILLTDPLPPGLTNRFYRVLAQ
jgi:hypothetical protein